jgi:hypothetical protein
MSSILPLLGIESEPNISILLLTSKSSKNSNQAENSYDLKILYGLEYSAQKTLKMLIDPAVFFKTYKCESMIVVHNGQKINKQLCGSIAKIVNNCDSELNIFFVKGGKANVGKISIDVTDLIDQKCDGVSSHEGAPHR